MKNTESKKYDVIIIGGGASGMSAALWCDELKLNTLLLEAKKELGGQLHIVHNPIENHLGVTAKNGKELNQIFLKQIENREFETRLNAEVKDINFTTKTVSLADGNQLSARAIIIATGVSRRKLGIDGEDNLQSKIVLESGKRDAGKVRGKTVCIIGGGDAAVENALILSETAAKVYLIHRGKEFRARSEFVNKLKNHANIQTLMLTTVVKIVNDGETTTVALRDSSSAQSSVLPVDAILIRIGVSPNTSLFQNKITLDAHGYIEVNAGCETNVENVFAVGDVANPVSPTISTAVGTGTTAGKILFGKLDNVH